MPFAYESDPTDVVAPTNTYDTGLAPLNAFYWLLFGLGNFGTVFANAPGRIIQAAGGTPQDVTTFQLMSGTGELRAAAGAAGAGLNALGALEARALAPARHLTHLTSSEAELAMIESELPELGGRWGLFAFDSSAVPTSAAGRRALTMIPRGDLAGRIPIMGEAASAFRAPPRFGPFSAWRRWSGVRNAPLGSVDLTRMRFQPNRIFRDGQFRMATDAELAAYRRHQWVLDYGVDAGIYLNTAVWGADLLHRDE